MSLLRWLEAGLVDWRLSGGDGSSCLSTSRDATRTLPDRTESCEYCRRPCSRRWPYLSPHAMIHQTFAVLTSKAS